MKLAKLSLAAVMAVGAFSTVNAQSLEDAIKGVDIKGYGYYRYHDASNAEAYSKIELRAQLTAPVQENVQFVTRFTASNKTYDSLTSGSATANVDRLMISYTGFQNTKVTIGRMYVGSPLDDTAGLGFKVVSSPVKGLTLAAAYFTDNSAVTNELAAAGVIYSDKMFNGRVWYIDKADEIGNDGASYLFVEAGANVGPVALKAQYASADPDAAAAPTASTIRLQATGKIDNFTLRAGYITNDDKAGDVTVDGSAEGDNDLIYGGIYGLVQNNTADLNTYFGEVKGKFGKFCAKAGYVSYDNGLYDSQYYGQVKYDVSKKLSTYVRYGSADPVGAGDDLTLMRFHAEYSF